MELSPEMVFSALGGAVWGAAAAFLGAAVQRSAARAESANAVMAASLGKTLIDAAALAAVYFLRGVLPMRWEAALIGTAVGLTAVGFCLSWRMSRRLKDQKEEDA